VLWFDPPLLMSEMTLIYVLRVLDILNTIFVIISGYIFYVCYYGELHSAIGWYERNLSLHCAMLKFIRDAGV
jgi:hypothetical protein